MRTRTEHVAWCKERALGYLPDDPDQAVASMVSDMRKHEETSCDSILAMIGLESVKLGSGAVKSWIKGFN